MVLLQLKAGTTESATLALSTLLLWCLCVRVSVSQACTDV